MMKHSRIAFFGTPQFAVVILDELKNAGIVPDLIVTAPDKPAGRGLALTAPAVKDWAVREGVEYIQPSSFQGEALSPASKASPLDALLNSEWDVFIVVAYGKILPQSLVELPRRGSLNVHPSLLPRFRGPSPIQSQILGDEKDVGVTIMQLDSEVDHGPILAQASITPDPWPLRATVLENMLAHEGGALLAEAIPGWLDGTLIAEAQDEEKATFTKKIEREDGQIDLTADGYQNYLKFCAYDEWPGVFFFQDGKRIKIVDATYERGTFTPTRVIPEGKAERAYLPPPPPK